MGLVHGRMASGDDPTVGARERGDAPGDGAGVGVAAPMAAAAAASAAPAGAPPKAVGTMLIAPTTMLSAYVHSALLPRFYWYHNYNFVKVSGPKWR